MYWLWHVLILMIDDIAMVFFSNDTNYTLNMIAIEAQQFAFDKSQQCSLIP